MKSGKNYIGVGVGALILNEKGELFLSRRGEKSRNEVGLWEFPGGEVEFGEKLEEAVKREVREEFGFSVKIIKQLNTFDHILGENEHWIAVAFLCEHESGEAEIQEPGKCAEFGWFEISSIPEQLTMVSAANLECFRAGVG
jgi:mutator protein MutT